MCRCMRPNQLVNVDRTRGNVMNIRSIKSSLLINKGADKYLLKWGRRRSPTWTDISTECDFECLRVRVHVHVCVAMLGNAD